MIYQTDEGYDYGGDMNENQLDKTLWAMMSRMRN